MKLNHIKTIIILVAITGCYYDVEEELYPNEICDTENVSYASEIVPILQNNCLVCHDAQGRQGGIVFDEYTKLKSVIAGGKLLGSIKRQPGFLAMPQDADQLLDCDIKLIESWINAGAPNN